MLFVIRRYRQWVWSFIEVYWKRFIDNCLCRSKLERLTRDLLEDQIAIIEDIITVFTLSRRAYCHILPLIENRKKVTSFPLWKTEINCCYVCSVDSVLDC